MKKIIALLLTLCMMLTAVAALAETRQYMTFAVETAEGIYVALLADEEGNVFTAAVDAEGNYEAIDLEFPIMICQLDDEAMTCVFGTEEQTIAGTVEITAQEETSVQLLITLEDGTQIVMIFDAVEDMCYFADDEGMTYYMGRLETAE